MPIGRCYQKPPHYSQDCILHLGPFVLKDRDGYLNYEVLDYEGCLRKMVVPCDHHALVLRLNYENPFGYSNYH